MAVGAAESCSRPARVGRPSYRGLLQLCHASVSGMELRDLGLVMLGGHKSYNASTKFNFAHCLAWRIEEV